MKYSTVFLVITTLTCFLLLMVLAYTNVVKFPFISQQLSINIQTYLPFTKKPVEKRSKAGFYVTMKNLPLPEKPLSDKYIIYRCTHLCGGLTDRQKGIVTAYVLSQMLRRKFGIIMKKGCDFSDFVIPNIVNWQVEHGTLEGKSTRSLQLIDNTKYGFKIRDGDLEVMFKEDVIFYQGNKDFLMHLMTKSSFQSLPWTKNRSHLELYKLAFAHLFRLAPKTEKKYADFVTKLSSKSLVCAHLRMGRSSTIPNDANRRIKPNIDVLVQFLQQKMDSSSHLFISTDSDDARKRMKNHFPSKFVEVEGKIVHIDRPGGALNCTGMEKSILDQFILTKCDVLVMSYSGFSWMAALVRGTYDQLYGAFNTNMKKIVDLEYSQLLI